MLDYVNGRARGLLGKDLPAERAEFVYTFSWTYSEDKVTSYKSTQQELILLFTAKKTFSSFWRNCLLRGQEMGWSTKGLVLSLRSLLCTLLCSSAESWLIYCITTVVVLYWRREVTLWQARKNFFIQRLENFGRKKRSWENWHLSMRAQIGCKCNNTTMKQQRFSNGHWSGIVCPKRKSLLRVYGADTILLVDTRASNWSILSCTSLILLVSPRPASPLHQRQVCMYYIHYWLQYIQVRNVYMRYAAERSTVSKQKKTLSVDGFEVLQFVWSGIAEVTVTVSYLSILAHKKYLRI